MRPHVEQAHPDHLYAPHQPFPVAMSIRSTALRWLAATHGIRDADIFTSKRYEPAQSWTGRAAWWVQIPVHRIGAIGGGAVHVVCEARPGGRDFHYLRVPAAYLREHLADLDVPGDGPAISLFLSAEPDSLFRDERGAGRVSFGQFVVGHGEGHGAATG